MPPADLRQEFHCRGYLLRRGLLADATAARLGVTRAMFDWMGRLHRHLPAGSARVDQTLCPTFAAERLVLPLVRLLGLLGRQVFDHLSPATNLRTCGFRFHPELPQPDRAPLLALVRHPRMLLTLARLLRGEPVLNALMQPVFCPHQRELAYMDLVARLRGTTDFEPQRLLARHLGAAPWHHTESSVLQGNPGWQQVTVILPMTRIDEEFGSLWLLPGSHRHGARRTPRKSELPGRTRLDLQAGDVLFLHSHLFISRTLSLLPGKAAHWWQLQFHRHGDADDRPVLPSLYPLRSGHDHGRDCVNTTWRIAMGRLRGRRLRQLGRRLELH